MLKSGGRLINAASGSEEGNILDYLAVVYLSRGFHKEEDCDVEIFSDFLHNSCMLSLRAPTGNKQWRVGCDWLLREVDAEEAATGSNTGNGRARNEEAFVIRLTLR